MSPVPANTVPANTASANKVPANASRFTFQIIGLPEAFKVLSFAGEEALSSLFEYRIEVLCDHEALPLHELLGNTAALTLVHQEHPRVVHGMVVAAVSQGYSGDQARYQITLKPQLYSLTLRSGYRIFQQQNVPEVVTTLLKEAGFDDGHFEWQLKEACATRDYIVQYGETEYEFLSRLLAEEGIHFHFRHDLDRHCLCFADHNAAFSDIPGEPGVRYCQQDNAASGQSIIRRLTRQQSAGINSVSVADYDFQKPNFTLRKSGLLGSGHTFGELEDYRYRSVQQETEAGLERLRRIRAESLSWQADRIKLETDEVRLAVGHCFTVSEHPNEDINQHYLLLSYQIEGRLPQSLEALASPEPSLYRCQAEAIPRGQAYRPVLIDSRPVVKGVQTAFVTGPKDQEIYTDRQGRIKVQFHWDRQGKRDENTSCWVRVSQALAGKDWGAQAVPRVGQEVIVAFEEGDPSRPLVTGAVYNSVNKPPYALPKHKSRSGIKTQSSQRGSGFNEVRIEDRKGKEKLFLRAEKNLDLRIRNLWQQWIKGDLHQRSQRLYHSVDKDLHQSVDGNLNQSTGQNLSFASGQDIHLKVSGAEVVQAGNKLHIKGGMRTVIQAGASLSVKVGGSYITLDASGVTVTGPLVRINEGGGRGSSAAGASPQSPEMPVLPDDDNAGRRESLPDPAAPHHWEGLSFQRGAAQEHTLASAARHHAAVVDTGAESERQPPDPELTRARKNWLAETFAEWSQWHDDTMETFDQVGEDPATPELLRFAAAALKTPAKLGTGLVSGAAGVGQLLTDPQARVQLADSVVDLYENPENIADAAEDFVSQPGHEIASDLFAFSGEMLMGGGAVTKAGKLSKGADSLPGAEKAWKASELEGGFHGKASGNRLDDAGHSEANGKRVGYNDDLSVNSSEITSDIVTTQIGGVPNNNRYDNALFSSDIRQTQPASQELFDLVASKRDVHIAAPGSDDLKFLDLTVADASAGGPGNLSIIVKENPQRLTLMEEFLHGTQSRMWGDPPLDVDDTVRNFREWHVRDFMNRHQNMFGWDADELDVLQTELDYYRKLVDQGK